MRFPDSKPGNVVLDLHTHQFFVKVEFVIADHVGTQNLYKTHPCLDLGEVEATLPSPLFFDHHQINKVEDGL